MKPLKGKTRIERVGERIRTEEVLLTLLAKEKPEHRIELFDRIAPYLKFRLSPGFDKLKLPDMPYAGRPSFAEMQKGIHSVPG